MNKRRWTDTHVIQQASVAIVIGFMSSMFTAFVATEKMAVELKNINRDIEQIYRYIDKLGSLSERVAVIEDRLNK